MVTILGRSDKPCFICGTREKTVELKFRDKSFAGTLCLEHMHEKLKAEESEEK